MTYQYFIEFVERCVKYCTPKNCS